jgi:DNA oxidative demethylase
MGGPAADLVYERRQNVFAAQSDLFDRPGLPGLALAEAIVTPSEERALIASIDGVELSPFRFPGWLGKRLTASYGWRYNFDTGSFGPADPIPDWLLPLREKAAGFARLTPDDLVQALVIRYDPGAGIG